MTVSTPFDRGRGSAKPISLSSYLTRLIAWCIAPLVILGILVGLYHGLQHQADRDREAENLARGLIAAIDRDLAMRISALRMLADAVEVADRRRWRDLYGEARGFARSFESPVAFGGGSAGAGWLFDTRRPFGSDVSVFPWPEAADRAIETGAPVVGKAIAGVEGQQPQVPVAVVSEPETDARFVFVNLVDASHFRALLEGIDLPRGWSLSLLAGSGETIARLGDSDDEVGPSAGRGVGVYPSEVSPWTVRLEMPGSVYWAPFFTTGAFVLLGILVAAATGIVGAGMAARRLGDEARSLESPEANDLSAPAISEFAALRKRIITESERLRRNEALLRGSEERFRRLFQSAPVPLALADPQGNLVDVNDAFAVVLGYTTEDIPSIDAWWEKAYPDPDYRRRVIETWNAGRAAATGAESAPTPLEFRVTCNDGVERPMLISGIELEEGTLAAFHDISERRQVERKLEESASVLRRAQYLSRLGNWAWDFEADIAWWSPEMYRIFGVDPSLPAADFKHIPRYFTEDSWQRLADAVDRCVRDGVPYELDAEVIREDGERRWVIARGDAHRDATGRIVELHGMMQDITRRKQAEHLTRAQRDLFLAVNQSRSLDDTLRLCLDTAVEVSGMDSGGIYLLEEDGTLLLREAHGVSDAFAEAVERFDPGTPLPRIVAAGEAAYDPRDGIPAEISSAQHEEGLKSFAVVPFRFEEKIIGTLVVASHEFDEVPAHARVALETVASGLGMLIGVSRADEARRVSDERLRVAQRVSGIGIWEWDVASGLIRTSPETDALYGIEPGGGSQTYDDWISRVHPADRPDLERTIDAYLEHPRAFSMEFRIVRKDGDVRWLISNGDFISNEDGQPARVLGTTMDITERKRTDDQLRRSQKMEVVGQMAGGVAHDFNNVLGIILGNVNLLKRAEIRDDRLRERLVQIERATARAIDLTGKLLGFSRRETSADKVVDLNRMLADMDSLVRRSITPAVDLSLQLATALWPVSVDPGDFEDALLNLVLNARDAMPDGGRLTLTTENTTLDAAYCRRNPEAIPGDYVVLSVSDTGEGMSRSVQEKIFEPFFTTKPRGKGTGLGLAMVYGFAKRSGGRVSVYSEQGNGTTFRIYLPKSEVGLAVSETSIVEDGELPRGSESILAVDDEPELLELVTELLQSLGYRVVTANGATEALARLETDPNVDLLFSDVLMPGGINGFELAEKATMAYPGLRVLLTSGHAGNGPVDRSASPFAPRMLRKPYTDGDLARYVRTALDDGKRAADDAAAPPSKITPKADSTLAWDASMEIGVAAIDRDHKRLFELINRGQRAVDAGETSVAIAAILVELRDYAETHFHREEAMMEACGYQDLAAHREEHARLIQRIDEMESEFQKDELTAQSMVRFLTGWLGSHVRDEVRNLRGVVAEHHDRIHDALGEASSSQRY